MAGPSVRARCGDRSCAAPSAAWVQLVDHPRGRPLLGVAAGQPTPALYAGYHDITGQQPALVEWFQSFAEPLAYPNQLALIAAHHSLPVITWIPANGGRAVPLAAIAAGRFDGYLLRSARLARSFPGTLAIRFAHEMNLPGHYDFAGGRAGPVFTAAWRHVVGVFRRAGADNVRWIWSPNVNCGGRCPFSQFYPGNAWVDAVSLDGYNNGSGDGRMWQSLDSVFATSYRELIRLSSKPVLITETASAGAADRRASWLLNGLLRTVPEQLPRVRAVILFDVDTNYDWEISPGTPAAYALRAVAHSTAYG